MFGLILYVYLSLITRSSAQGCSALNDYTTANPYCKVHSSCLQVECTQISLIPNLVASLVVSNCEDPLKLDLHVYGPSGYCNKTYSISGKGQSGEVAMDEQQLNASYTRNASHLEFYAFTVLQDGQLSPLIPSIVIPLNPAACMCSSIRATTESFNLPLAHSCLSDAGCGGFHCNVSLPGGAPYASHYIIDPCRETLKVNVSTTSGKLLYERVLNKSQTLQVPLGSFIVPVYVIIIHYNYSVQISVVMNYITKNITILPLQQVILDRSSCDPFIPFKAAPIPNDRNTGAVCFSNGSHSTNGTKPGSGVPLAVLVAVPLVCIGIILGICIFVIVVISIFLYYYHKRKRTVQFQRMAFDEIHDD